MGLQERIEQAQAGRRAISAAIVVLLALMVAANLPDSRLRDEVMRVGGPVLTAVGAGQNWDVFAPDPFPTSIDAEIRFVYEDGSRGRWDPPDGEPFLSPYRDYRWHKLVSRLDDDALAVGLLSWVVLEEDGRRPVALARLVRRERRNARPGRPAGDHGPWRETVLLELGRIPG